MKKYHIAIDIDDTITYTFDYLMPYVAEYFNKDINYLIENNISYTTLTDDIKDREVEFGKKYYDKVALDIPVKEDAIIYINKLKEDGHKITFLTARNSECFKNPKAISKKYLDKYGILYDDIICNKNKAIVCKENNIDMLIDDSMTNCRSVQNIGLIGILFLTKINRNNDINVNCFNWEEIYNYINELDM